MCSRQQILYAAQRVEPSFKQTQLRYLMGVLLDSGVIVRVGRNQYKKAGKEPMKSIFTGAYSPVALQAIQYMQERFPLLSYRVWELSWLNEFFNHQLAHNQIIVEVEKDGCDFVFSSLVERFPGRVLLRPKAQEILHYGSDDGIIIDRLVTDAPRSDGEPYQVPLEKLIVDLFANKNLMLSKGAYPSAIEMMFAKYRIEQVSMLRYARRRNRSAVEIDDTYFALFLSKQKERKVNIYKEDQVRKVRYPLEFKARVVATAIRERLEVPEVATRFGISTTAANNWLLSKKSILESYCEQQRLKDHPSGAIVIHGERGEYELLVEDPVPRKINAEDAVKELRAANRKIDYLEDKLA